jgi:hypothetical protein
VSAEDVRAGLVNPPSYLGRPRRARQAGGEGLRPPPARRPSLRLRPDHPRTTARRSALQELVKIFFGGSAGQAASALLKQEHWTDDELDALSAEIARVRDERKRP